MEYNITLNQSELNTLIYSINEALIKTEERIEYIETRNAILNSPGYWKEQIDYYMERLDSFESMGEKLRKIDSVK